MQQNQNLIPQKYQAFIPNKFKIGPSMEQINKLTTPRSSDSIPSLVDNEKMIRELDFVRERLMNSIKE